MNITSLRPFCLFIYLLLCLHQSYLSRYNEDGSSLSWSLILSETFSSVLPHLKNSYLYSPVLSWVTPFHDSSPLPFNDIQPPNCKNIQVSKIFYTQLMNVEWFIFVFRTLFTFVQFRTPYTNHLHLSFHQSSSPVFSPLKVLT